MAIKTQAISRLITLSARPENTARKTFEETVNLEFGTKMLEFKQYRHTDTGQVLATYSTQTGIFTAKGLGKLLVQKGFKLSQKGTGVVKTFVWSNEKSNIVYIPAYDILIVDLQNEDYQAW